MVSSISVVIPVYNSELTLAPLVARLEPVLAREARAFEIILVNDGSHDQSWNVIRELAVQHACVRGINLMRNYGQHNALLCGIRQAKYGVIVTMDDDLQHPPEEIPKLLEKMAEGYDVVYGVPRKLPHSFARNLLSKLSKRVLSWTMGVKSLRDINAFRAIRTELRRAFSNYQSPQLLLDVLLSWGTTRFGVVVVDHCPRQLGKSNYTLRKLVNQLLLILTGFSTAPLRLASLVGLTFTCFGVGVLIYVIARYLLQGSIPGFPFLASIIAIFSGAQLFALGIIGEYLARMFNRSMERPAYVISEMVEPTGQVDRSLAFQQARHAETSI
ncbi:MAG: glycosyltransferase family 2 protein [Acidobacteriota bacterium]|nr:glycosyltransferase family 2 protein [Blastocatellia bacterium]MDW8240526.1 glycosyltransferase family 2 protein [Acidobacteriota bacterium]